MTLTCETGDGEEHESHVAIHGIVRTFVTRLAGSRSRHTDVRLSEALTTGDDTYTMMAASRA